MKYRQKVASILTGWWNFVNDVTTEQAKARAAICAKCPEAKEGTFSRLIKDEVKEINGLVCGVCSCPLSAKVRSSEESCPLQAPKW